MSCCACHLSSLFRFSNDIYRPYEQQTDSLPALCSSRVIHQEPGILLHAQAESKTCLGTSNLGRPMIKYPSVWHRIHMPKLLLYSYAIPELQRTSTTSASVAPDRFRGCRWRHFRSVREIMTRGVTPCIRKHLGRGTCMAPTTPELAI